MGYSLEVNCLIRLPEEINVPEIKAGDVLEYSKDGGRFYPVNIPMEFCDQNYKYIGKAEVIKLEIKDDITNLKIKVLKVFSEEESKIFTDNFIKI